MPRCLPERPRFASPAEQLVWERLRSTLRPDDLLVANQRITDRSKDHEIDMIVVLPDAGVVVVEVKGGALWHDGRSWHRRWNGRDATLDPVDQVRTNKYAVRDYVEHDPRWRDSSRRRVRWAHALVLPATTLPEEFSLPDCPRWSVVDSRGLDTLAARLREIPVRQQSPNRAPDLDDVELIAEILRGRGLPQRDLVAEAAARDQQVQVQLTQEQGLVLDATRLLRRVEVRGGAGSGKTFLAMERARRLARDGERVALVCYSHGLASYLRRVVAGWPRRQQPAYVGEFHALGRLWGAPQGPPESDRSADAARFWERELPERMTRLAAALDPGHRFDSIVVDEAQDFADAWWAPLLSSLRDGDDGGLYVFSDEGQRVFDRFGAPPVPLVPLVLDHNLRNTRQIADTFNPLTDVRMRLLGGDGPDVRFVPCPAPDAIDVADREVDRLLAEGWRPQDVALLATGSRHPEQVARQDRGQQSYWDTFWDADQVFYGHVLGFKGLERSAVVLAVNGGLADRGRERLYVGLSRARDQLVVCGDPREVRAVVGEDVARRLGTSGPT